MSVQGPSIAAAADLPLGLATIADLPEPRQFTFNRVARAASRVAFGRLAGRSLLRRFIHRFRNG